MNIIMVPGEKMQRNCDHWNKPQVGNIFADGGADEGVSCQNHNCKNVKIQMTNFK